MRDYRIEQTGVDRFIVVTPNGTVARDINRALWSTSDHDKAVVATAFLAEGRPKTGADWLKSTFGAS
jgi:hypothetical protein